MTIYEQQRGKNKWWRLVKEEGAEIQCSPRWNSPTDLQNAQKPHKTNTVCRPALHEEQQMFGLLTMNQPQRMWAFTNNVGKTNNRTSFCRGKKNSQSSSWPMFQSSLSLTTVLHKKMKLCLPSHGNLLPETEQGMPKKVHKFQEFLFSLWGEMWHKMPFLCPPASGSQPLCCACCVECVFLFVCDSVNDDLRVWWCVCVCSWCCGDGVQVLHQALQVGHLLGQLVRLVALRERNRVTAGGGGGTGGEGGKHLEGGRRREERKGGEERVS